MADKGASCLTSQWGSLVLERQRPSGMHQIGRKDHLYANRTCPKPSIDSHFVLLPSKTRLNNGWRETCFWKVYGHGTWCISEHRTETVPNIQPFKRHSSLHSYIRVALTGLLPKLYCFSILCSLPHSNSWRFIGAVQVECPPSAHPRVPHQEHWGLVSAPSCWVGLQVCDFRAAT